MLLVAFLGITVVKAKADKTKPVGATTDNMGSFSASVSVIGQGEVMKIMEQVADWQIAHQNEVKRGDLDWGNATLYIGMLELARMPGNDKYRKWLTQLGRKNRWQPGGSMYMADDIAVSQMYLGMYRDQKDERMLFPTQARTEWILRHPSISIIQVDYRDYHTLERWSWCDALFMAPPVYAQMYNISKDVRYLEFMDKEFKNTYELLYDQNDHLFYRDHRFIDQKSENGKKIFWARGNGWVLGGLVNILKEIPESSQYRFFYMQLFRKMCEQVSQLQGSNGYWPASLLESESYPDPETSGSAFFVYALAFGVNNGLLDKEKYYPIVMKGWEALENAVTSEGKLCWVQPGGDRPKRTTEDMTEVYGVGAFLLAGSEIYKLSER